MREETILSFTYPVERDLDEAKRETEQECSRVGAGNVTMWHGDKAYYGELVPIKTDSGGSYMWKWELMKPAG